MLSKDTLDFFEEGILEQYPHDKMLNAYKDIARDVSHCYKISQVVDCSMVIGHLMTKYPLDDDYIKHLKGLLSKLRTTMKGERTDDRYKR